jgi:hypothetical protein
MMIAMMRSVVELIREEPQALVVHGCLLPSLVSSHKQHHECLGAPPPLELKQSHEDTASDRSMLTHFVQLCDSQTSPNPKSTSHSDAHE